MNMTPFKTIIIIIIITAFIHQLLATLTICYLYNTNQDTLCY
jgi:hypothetical protein